MRPRIKKVHAIMSTQAHRPYKWVWISDPKQPWPPLQTQVMPDVDLEANPTMRGTMVAIPIGQWCQPDKDELRRHVIWKADHVTWCGLHTYQWGGTTAWRARDRPVSRLVDYAEYFAVNYRDFSTLPRSAQCLVCLKKIGCSASQEQITSVEVFLHGIGRVYPA